MLRTDSALLTVVTPTYNRAQFLPETIESVLSQDYKRIEFIVLDDGSTDATTEVLRSYGDRLVWQSHPNMGETRTVNLGLGVARGDLIAVVNSDDPVLPHWAARMVEFIESRPEVLVAYPDWLKIDVESRPLAQVRTYDYDYSKMLRWHQCFPGPGTIVRRRAFDLVGLRDTRYRYIADFDFWLRAGMCGPFARLPSVLATFRVHGDSASISQQGLAMAAEHLDMLDRLFARDDLPPEAKMLEDEAYSAGLYAAGLVVMTSDLGAARRFFFRALRRAPGSFADRQRLSSLVVILSALMPERAFRSIRGLRRWVKHTARLARDVLRSRSGSDVPIVRL